MEDWVALYKFGRLAVLGIALIGVLLMWLAARVAIRR